MGIYSWTPVNKFPEMVILVKFIFVPVWNPIPEMELFHEVVRLHFPNGNAGFFDVKQRLILRQTNRNKRFVM